jgi:hypothetical protein
MLLVPHALGRLLCYPSRRQVPAPQQAFIAFARKIAYAPT